MAWGSFAIGALAALVLVILGYTVLGLPLWAALFCYPIVGVLVALIVMLNAYAYRKKADQKALKSHPPKPNTDVSKLRESDS